MQACIVLALAAFGWGQVQELNKERELLPLQKYQPSFVTVPRPANFKASEELRIASHARGLVKVVLLLTESPQQEVFDKVRKSNASEEIAVGQLLKMALAGADKNSIEIAQRESDKLLLKSRREAAFEIKRRIRPQQDRVKDWLAARGATLRHEFEVLNLISAEVPAELIRELEQHEDVAQLDLVQEQSSLLDRSTTAMQAPVLWQSGFTGAGESVLVLDSGINAAHTGFGGRISAAGFVNNNPTCSPAEKASTGDSDGHGTHVAGIIASAGTALFPQHRGVAFGLGTLYSAKISCANGRSYSDSALAATITALLAFPVTVVNNSNGSRALIDSDLYTNQIDALIDGGALFWVNAAGNDGPNPASIFSPATAFNGISVANVDTSSTPYLPASSSSRGPTPGGRKKPDLAAPGTGINSTSHVGSGFASMTGTSMAAPHVAGAAVLLRQAGVRNHLAVKALLANSSDHEGWSADRGWGFINLGRAFAQKDFRIADILSPTRDTVRIYRATVPPNSTIYNTMTWNRHFKNNSSVLRNFDMVLFDRETGADVDSSSSRIDNVEQVAGRNGNPSSRDVVVLVLANDDGNGVEEPFALASSFPIQRVIGPSFNATCALVGSASANSTASVSCSITNRGDLEMLESSATLSSEGISLAAQSFGPTQIGQTVTRVFTIRTASAGTMPLRLDLNVSGFGVSADFWANYTIPVNSQAQSCSYIVSPTSTTVAQAGGSVSITVSTNAGCAWSATGLPAWLSATSGVSFTGSGNFAIRAAANPSSAERVGTFLISGQTITIRQPGGTAAFEPSISGITDATGSGTVISSGAWVSVFGANFSRSTRTWTNGDFAGRLLPVKLDGLTVTINGKPAYISYASPTQINVLAPDDPQTGNVQVVVTNQDGRSATAVVSKQAASPAFFTFASGSTRFVAAVHPDGALVAASGLFTGIQSRPARRGGSISLFATGCGVSSPPTPAGEIVSVPSPLAGFVHISSGSLSFPIQYSGIVSSGLCQFNVEIPAGLATGNVPLTLQIETFRSTVNVMLPVL